MGLFWRGGVGEMLYAVKAGIIPRSQRDRRARREIDFSCAAFWASFGHRYLSFAKPKPKQTRSWSPARPDGTRLWGDESLEAGRDCRRWTNWSSFYETQALARLLANFCLKMPVDARVRRGPSQKPNIHFLIAFDDFLVETLNG